MSEAIRKFPRLASIDIQGFRSFGTEAGQLAEFGDLTIIHAANSQGKSSLAEAIEFLLTGTSCRRELLGGAKAEFSGSLRNAYASAEAHTCVEASIVDDSGDTKTARRALIQDYEGAQDCEVELHVDGSAGSDAPPLGFVLGEAPLAAPVLLQHSLRYVLSTEPKQRVGYFKALLSLTDLDVLASAVASARTSLEREPSLPMASTIDGLRGTRFAPVAALLDISGRFSEDELEVLMSAAVLAAVKTLGADVAPTDFSEALGILNSRIEESREAVFPFAALGSPDLVRVPASVPVVDSATYEMLLGVADAEAARLAPIFELSLSLPELQSVTDPIDCPLCGTEQGLTARRLEELRAALRETSAISKEVTRLRRVSSDLIRVLEAESSELRKAAADAGRWDDADWNEVGELLERAQLDAEVLAELRAGVKDLDRCVSDGLKQLATGIEIAKQVDKQVAKRESVDGGLGAAVEAIGACLATASETLGPYRRTLSRLRQHFDQTIDAAPDTAGFVQMQTVLSDVPESVAAILTHLQRKERAQRLKLAESEIKTAAGKVLDERFDQMSDAIQRWWLSIRPEELVAFAGVRRRAKGARFVNLVGTLRPSTLADPVERDALGVFSDSQLNALGLSTFLARNELLGGSIVVLDDPVPGSDSEHRLTFVQNTLGQLMADGVQVVLLTHDPKLADWAASAHSHRQVVSYELNLGDGRLGTIATQTSDQFSQFMLAAEDNINAPSANGRRAAANSLRSAAERLAKQIVATGRTHDGQPCSVADINAEASMLGGLVPLVVGYALDAAERGNWKLFGSVLNPGSHDDDVPSTVDLKQVRGNLRQIVRAHKKSWPDGLLT